MPHPPLLPLLTLAPELKRIFGLIAAFHMSDPSPEMASKTPSNEDYLPIPRSVPAVFQGDNRLEVKRS